MNAPIQPPRRSRRRWLLLPVLLLVAGGIGYWQYRESQARTREAANVANARGIGFLEQYLDKQADGREGFDNATDQFAEAMRLAPEWLVPKINFGMSLLLTGDEAKIARSIPVFESILQTEPTNPYAHHCLGVVYLFRGTAESKELAYRHFTAVTEADPNDAYGWYFRGYSHPNRDESDEARADFERAIQLDPYLSSARFSLKAHLSINDPKVQAQMQVEIDGLENGRWARRADIKPSKLGKYGTPIGMALTAPPRLEALPAFEQSNTARVTLEPGTTWAATAEGTLKSIRGRFGGTMIRLDFDKDDAPDLLLLSAVVRNGKVGDVLLHNDGGGKFTDVTTSYGLSGNASLGAAVGDYDNSGFSDLVLTSETGVKLYRNKDGKVFEDATAVAGLDTLKGQFLTAAWLDLEQDGDLDLLLAKYETTPGKSDGQVVAFANIGEAPAGEPPPPLATKFQRFENPAFAVAGAVVGFLVSDLENDGDVDVIVFVEGQLPIVVVNDRLLRFRRGAALADALEKWTGGLTIDVNGDEQSDLVLLAGSAKPTIFTTTTDRVGNDIAGRFAKLETESPPLLQGHAIDVDHDGRMDAVGLSASRKLVVLRGKQNLQPVESPFGPKPDTVADTLAVAVCDMDRDCNNDLLLWSASEGMLLFRNLGNGNRGLRLQPTGQRDKDSARTNQDAIGVKVTAYTGSIRTHIENTTLTAGLGQSRLPLDFGIGKATSANAVRIAWPDVVPQAEVDVPSCETRRIRETDRRPSSCPVLFTWDGTKFRYVTDILGAGSMGELSADGGTRPPRPEESVKIEANQLTLRNGRYTIKLAEPMDELMYLDHVRLDVVDHAADAIVFPDERFATAEPAPTQHILSFRQRFSPLKAVDHRGRDVMELLRSRDECTVYGFRKRGWHGFAEEHFVELDFGNQLAQVKPDVPLYLVLAGWTDYAFPETIFAANQAGVPMKPPTLEVQKADGTWAVFGEIGFPAGLPRVMTSPVKGLAGSAACRVRIRTNMHISWDQIQIAVAEPTALTTHQLHVAAAKMDRRGFAKEIRPNGKPPAVYDDSILEPVTFTPWRGKLTRLGDVTELLTSHDDRFAICGPGDEIVIDFDAAKLPPLPSGQVRSFVLRSHGYCKDAAPFTATFGEVGPLPYRAMTDYPAGTRDRAKAPPEQAEYDRLWNTRSVGTR